MKEQIMMRWRITEKTGISRVFVMRSHWLNHIESPLNEARQYQTDRE